MFSSKLIIYCQFYNVEAQEFEKEDFFYNFATYTNENYSHVEKLFCKVRDKNSESE